MPEGAMMSAPARAYERAARPRFSSVASLSSWPSVMTPQWPCVVYSQKQASTATVSSGTAFLRARMAFWTTPSWCQASLPTSSFFDGRPNRMTPGMPSFAISSASRASASTEKWNWPGSDEISRRTPVPGQTKSGKMKLSGESVVSRTRRRSAGVRRRRRGRVSGKAMRESVADLFELRPVGPERARERRHARGVGHDVDADAEVARDGGRRGADDGHRAGCERGGAPAIDERAQGGRAREGRRVEGGRRRQV